MAVNLFKAQDDLNNLIGQAKTPEQISAAKVYLNQLANGANKEIPQFMALNVLNQMESSNPTPPPPTGTIKDKLTGVAPQQPQQPQQGAPVQGAPMPAPQQHPQAMTSGGIAHLPVDEKMYNFKEGGVIGFKTGDPVPDPTFKGLYAQAKQEAADYAQNMEKPVDPDVARAQYIKDHPEMAMLGQLPGQELQKGIAKQEAAQNAEYQRQLDQGKTNQALNLSNALIQAAEQTRGTRGLGGLGPALAGFGGTFNASTKEEQERVNKLNASKQEKDLLILKYKSDLESAQRAAAEGRYSEKLAYQHSMADSINKAKLMGFDLDSKALTSAAGIDEAKIHAAATYAAANKPSDFMNSYNILKSDPKNQNVSQEELLRKASIALHAPQEGGVQERMLGVALANKAKIRDDMNIKIGLTSPVGSPAHNAALAEIARREGEIDAQISAVMGGAPTASPGTPPPAAGPGGLPTTLHYDANGNRIG
jgi:hypothetical protein